MVGAPCATLGFRLHTALCHLEWSTHSLHECGGIETRRAAAGRISGGVTLKMTRRMELLI